jgi:hypothetical protein
MSDVLDWLLQENQPSIHYRCMRQLLEMPESNPEVKSARTMIAKKGWAVDLLANQSAAGWWVTEKSFYRPKYTATNWMLLVLADLGLTRREPRIRNACELWIQRFAKKDGGFGTEGMRKSELCLVGNTARALVQFGYADHPKVRSALDWLITAQKVNGGWHCWGKNGVLDAWEGMSAFAVYPKQKWTRSIKRAVERGAEFYLERELHKQGAHYGPWYRFHYPIHYYYDLLVGLDFLTALGFGSDRRLKYATQLLKDKRRSDGRWNLDAVHPDLDGAYAGWYKRRRPTAFALERAAEPSKMITLKALIVLKRIEGSEMHNYRSTRN